MKTFLFSILFIFAHSLFSQSVKGLEFITTITSSGIAEGGTTTTSTIVITSNLKNIQISSLLPETSSLYKRLKLNEFDTLTIIFRTYVSHINSNGEEIKDDKSIPTFIEEGKQKQIIFNCHPKEFDLYNKEHSFTLEYFFQGNTYSILLPEHIVKEYRMP